MSRAARTARTQPSPTIPAATGIAQSARVRRQKSGSPSAPPICCRCRIHSGTSHSCQSRHPNFLILDYQSGSEMLNAGLFLFVSPKLLQNELDLSAPAIQPVLAFGQEVMPLI